MIFKREEEINIANKLFYIIDVINYENNEYLYVEEIEDDELIDSYSVYRYDKDSNSMELIKDKEKLTKLLQLFVESINKDI